MPLQNNLKYSIRKLGELQRNPISIDKSYRKICSEAYFNTANY